MTANSIGDSRIDSSSTRAVNLVGSSSFTSSSKVAAMPAEPSEGAPPAPSRFLTTQWSLVARDAAVARAALAGLCQLYWYPVYAFIRRSGHAHDDALDLTQGFFAGLIEKNVVAQADRSC